MSVYIAKDIQSGFERQLFQKIGNVTATADSAEVVTVRDKTAVFCGGGITHMMNPGMSTSIIQQPNQMTRGAGGDVRVIVVGPADESELVLASFCEGLFDALSKLMGGQTDRTMVLDNLELVLLLIDEHCDGGIVLEVDPNKLVNSVLLRDGEENMGGMSNAQGMQEGPAMGGAAGHGMNMGSLNQGEMTIAQAFRQAREQLMTGLAQRDGGF